MNASELTKAEIQEAQLKRQKELLQAKRYYSKHKNRLLHERSVKQGYEHKRNIVMNQKGKNTLAGIPALA